MPPSSSSKSRKNASGSRTDVSWEYSIPVEENKRKVKYKYCSKIVMGGIFRFKHHLASTGEDTIACVHTKKRNRLHQKKMNDLVFVMYNCKLNERQTKKYSSSSLKLDDLSSDDEWITLKEDLVDSSSNEWLCVLDGSSNANDGGNPIDNEDGNDDNDVGNGDDDGDDDGESGDDEEDNCDVYEEGTNFGLD
ncbi:HAT family dimerization domain containing protein [Quillaja saponaria]|uniref:HAT family dimerization domain containing protein n=1 Tax=Quillaja saponaria TaxID=32244 RepID=A0AAD7PYX8_QUISA|nr:HAT family dimerization domain containing protein [Quillaja saponaria]